MSPAELLWLGSVAAGMRSVVEVGCLHGRSAFMLLTACPGPVYCIDPWDDEADASYPSFMGSCGHFPNLQAVRNTSPEAAACAPEVDMTFLDGAHAYGAVLADIAAWLPKTNRLLCGHDYQNEDAGYPGVAKAVNAVFGRDRVVVPDGTSIWTVDLSLNRSVLASAPSGPLEWLDEYERASSAVIGWPA
jgi:predicted O-methyltransferase YrrM